METLIISTLTFIAGFMLSKFNLYTTEGRALLFFGLFAEFMTYFCFAYLKEPLSIFLGIIAILLTMILIALLFFDRSYQKK